MPITLTHIRNELFPGLAAIGRESGYRIDTYRDFLRDVVMVSARRGEETATLEITAQEMENGKYIKKLANLMELLMCSKSSGVPVTVTQAQLAMQQKMREVLADNMYREEFGSFGYGGGADAFGWPGQGGSTGLGGPGEGMGWGDPGNPAAPPFGAFAEPEPGVKAAPKSGPNKSAPNKPHDPRTLDLEPVKPLGEAAAPPSPDLILDD
jgi:hypothetical protein